MDSSSFDPFQYSTHTLNPNSIPLMLLSESLPNLQHKQHLQILASSKSETQENQEMNPATSRKVKRKAKTNASKPTQRKRIGKKDRHSKIYTAQGPRDRRMRLSLQVARKFFDLQDMLGFDKASKTIDWLFSKSKSAIEEVINSFPDELKRSVFCSPEGEVISGIRKNTEKRSKKSEINQESREKARVKELKNTANPSNLEELDSAENDKILDLENQEMKSSPPVMEEGQKDSGAGTCMVPVHQMDSWVTSATESTLIFDLSNPNGADFMVQSSGNINVHVENPNSSFMADPAYALEHKANNPNFLYQDQSFTSLLMASIQPHEQNPNLLYMNFGNFTHQIGTRFTENNFSSNPSFPIKYDGSYVLYPPRFKETK